MRIVIAECSVDYSGRLDAHLPLAPRVIMIKADGSVLIHSDGGSYKPLNWMSAPCTLSQMDIATEDAQAGVTTQWVVRHDKNDGQLIIRIHNIIADYEHDLGIDPGLVKDGVEAHLQQLLAEQVPDILGHGWTLVRREFPTPVGPVDLLVRDDHGQPVAIEVKRRGEIDGVEQLTRYLELLSRQAGKENIRGIFAAQEIRPQARTLAEDRDIECLVLDYDEMRGIDDKESRLF